MNKLQNLVYKLEKHHSRKIDLTLERTFSLLKKLGNPYSEVLLDKNGNIGIDWGVYGIPETFVINSQGVIKYRHVGAITKKDFKKINVLISKLK